jgi:hypothetical protein
VAASGAQFFGRFFEAALTTLSCGMLHSLCSLAWFNFQLIPMLWFRRQMLCSVTTFFEDQLIFVCLSDYSSKHNLW